MMRFCPIASGSSGNCVYVGTDKTNLLVDAGLSGKRIEAALKQLDIGKPTAVLVTHEHSDHVSGAGILSRKFKIPVYASPNTWRYLTRHNTIGKVDEDKKCIANPGEPFVIGDMEVLPFDVPHDASQPVGYHFSDGRHKAAVATDMGYVTDTVRKLLKGVNVMLIESNHDLEMLQNGRYPKALKERVMSERGHLSNVAAGVLLAEIAADSDLQVYLGHLSEENNRPMIALDTVLNILEANDINIKNLRVADRHDPGEMIEI